MQGRAAIRGAAGVVVIALAAVALCAPLAAEVVSGALALTITGFVRTEAFGGQLDDARQDPRYARGLDFRNDTELHLLARARSTELGIEYGAQIELAADTDEVANTKETWLFARGGWGEVRLGDLDGVAKESAVGAQDIAAGTGGIAGDVVDEIAYPVVFLTGTDTATKLRYYTPGLAGFSLGVSYAPTIEVIDEGELNGQFIAHKSGTSAMQARNVAEAGLIYAGELGGLELLASLVGITGTLRNDAREELGGSASRGWQVGATADLLGLQFGASYGDERLGAIDRSFFTLGGAIGDEEWALSLTYGQALDTDGVVYRHPRNLVLSGTVVLAPGLDLAADLGWFDNDGRDPEHGLGDRGWQAVGRLGVAF